MENNNLQCPKCKSTNLIDLDTKYICNDCGLEMKVEHKKKKSLGESLLLAILDVILDIIELIIDIFN